ncbi:TetR family transcriptional regulator [Salinibacterium hongtaonis]|uniref:TetR family transcriptional regulator n=1 Tax=Homoserinimonas hongtaonis TaxID=2079791 RepID=UPI00131EFBD8|nr:TetR family transcriptional regulator [Salinibacterium hongtaonis]
MGSTTSVPPVRRKRLPNTRQRLLDASTALFAARGFHGTTTRDIAAATGITAGAVYAHYASKEEILFTIIRDGHSAIIELLYAAISERETPLAQTYAGLRMFALAQVEQLARARVVHYELTSLSPEHLELVREQRREIFAIMASTIERGVAEGVFVVDNLPMAVLGVQGVTIDIARWYPVADPGVPASPAQIATQVAHMGLRILGVGADQLAQLDAQRAARRG